MIVAPVHAGRECVLNFTMEFAIENCATYLDDCLGTHLFPRHTYSQPLSVTPLTLGTWACRQACELGRHVSVVSSLFWFPQLTDLIVMLNSTAGSNSPGLTWSESSNSLGSGIQFSDFLECTSR